jgi:hypothetical protein
MLPHIEGAVSYSLLEVTVTSIHRLHYVTVLDVYLVAAKIQLTCQRLVQDGDMVSAVQIILDVDLPVTVYGIRARFYTSHVTPVEPLTKKASVERGMGFPVNEE